MTPLLFHRDDDGLLLLIAANGAADWEPDWFLSLLADPHVDVDIDGVVHPGKARVLVGDLVAIMVLPAGARTFRREWAAVIPRGATVALAHDADDEGEGAGRSLVEEVERYLRDRRD